jgi:phosphatidylserine decarboxylase
MNRNLIWTEGRAIVIISAVLLLLSLLGSLVFEHAYIRAAFWIINIVISLFIVFSIYFFRNPTRVFAESDQDALCCPADGTIVDIVQTAHEQRISIFLSPFNVHVNWIPMSGRIEKVTYKPGQFIAAYVPKSSELNERLDIVITNNNYNAQRTIIVRQIAGMLARRIVCWATEHMFVKSGEKYGMIKFSSRVDIILPLQVTLAVTLGQKVRGGETVIGRWSCC